jgi:SagB-type dehydrogenase family enzyme
MRGRADPLSRAASGDEVSLPPPRDTGPMSVEEAIARRRSVRDFRPQPLGLVEVSQLLWSAQGVTSPEGLRAAPSAGARYPIEMYLVCEQGLFHYRFREHSIVKVQESDLRRPLADACHGQSFIAVAAVSIVFSAVYERTTARYGERGIRYVHMDIGHAAENVHLQAEAMGLGSVPIGAFDDAAVADVLRLPNDRQIVYIVSIGHLQRD